MAATEKTQIGQRRRRLRPVIPHAANPHDKNPGGFGRGGQRIAIETYQPKTKSLAPQELTRLAITRFQRVRAMRAVLLLLLRHSLALVAPAAKPRATSLGALTDEVLDVAQWVGTNADQLPIGEYAPFAAAGAAAGAMAVSGAAVLRECARCGSVIRKCNAILTHCGPEMLLKCY